MTHSPPHGFRNNFRPLSILYYAFCFQAAHLFLFCNPDLNHAEIQALLAHYLLEEKREEIYDRYQESLREEQKESLDFSSDIDELKQLIDTDD